MKTVIIACGNLGATKKAAKLLASKIDGEAELFDASCGGDFDFSGFDVYVFGSNVRISSLNSEFRKLTKKLREFYSDKRAYCYVCGMRGEKGGAYAAKAAKRVAGCLSAEFVGGVLDASNATGFVRNVISDVIADMKAKGKPLPQLDRAAIERLANRINADDKK